MTLVPVEPTTSAFPILARIALPISRTPSALWENPANAPDGSEPQHSLHARELTRTPRWGMLCHKVQIHPAD